MHKIWVYKSNSKLHLIDMKIGMHVKTNPTVGFSKYEFNNKLLVDITFFRVTTRVTWT